MKLLIVLLNSAVSVREHCQVVNHSQVLKGLISYLLYQDLGADCGFCCCMHGFIRACLLIYLLKFFQRRQRVTIFSGCITMEKSICSFTPHPWCSRPHLITLKDDFNRDFTRDYVNKVWVHVALAMHIKGSHSKLILENACGLKLVLSQVPTKQELVLGWYYLVSLACSYCYKVLSQVIQVWSVL